MAITLAAETGYRGLEWGMTVKQVAEKKPAKKRTDVPMGLCYDFLVEQDIILRENTDIYYFFNNSKLISIAYVVDIEKEAELLGKMNASDKYTLITHLEGKFEESEIKQGTKEDAAAFASSYSFSKQYESTDNMRGIFGRQENSNVKIVVFDYNEDTEIHIFSNTYKDKIIVIYLAKNHDQDF